MSGLHIGSVLHRKSGLIVSKLILLLWTRRNSAWPQQGAGFMSRRDEVKFGASTQQLRRSSCAIAGEGHAAALIEVLIFRYHLDRHSIARQGRHLGTIYGFQERLSTQPSLTTWLYWTIQS